MNRLNQKYDQLIWMKLSEISRYWAAKELTSIYADKNSIKLKTPFATSNFTIKLDSKIKNPGIKDGITFVEIQKETDLKPNTFYTDKTGTILCFDLKKGKTELDI